MYTMTVTELVIKKLRIKLILQRLQTHSDFNTLRTGEADLRF